MSNTVRRRPAARKPQPDVDFDLDVYEVEANQRPFTFRLGEETFAMRSPQEVDWQVQLAAASGNPADTKALLEEMLGDDYPRFAAKKLPAAKLEALLTRCTEHFGIALPE